jgi:FixJ family two-component response regulator
MMDEKNTPVTTGNLIYDGERDCLLLDGHELSRGENVEIHVFGSWIPGQVAMDSAGWYLVTLDQVGIRLQTGLPARSCEFRFSETMALQPVKQEASPHILLVDDDPALLNALPKTISLRIPDAHVETANSSEMALERIQQMRYDAIVSDIKMPGMDGLALLTKIQEFQPETPTILITGHGEHNIAVQALRGGAYDYIQKPIERDNFAAALLRAIQTCQLRRQVHEQQHSLEMYARSLERLVQQRTNELAEAHTTKDRVISLVSQELKEPVARLKGIIQLLRQKLGMTELSEVVRQSFEDIEISISRTEDLVQELLNASDIETQRFILHRQRCDLVALCREVLVAETIGTDIELQEQIVDGPIDVDVDGEQVHQVLHMLIDGTRMSSTREAPTTVSLQRASDEAIITMRDRSSRSGLGSGFYVSRKIVERHGGHLELQTFPENRRTLFLSLPLFKRQDSQSSPEPVSVPRIHATWTMFYSASQVPSETA